MYSSIVRSLPFLIPFTAPEGLERMLRRKMELRLGANESNFGISPTAREAMAQAIDRVGWYGDPECYELREELAAKHGVSIENIVVSAGADDILSLCARVFLDPGDRAVNSLGGYPTFNYGVQGAGSVLELVPYKFDCVDLLGLTRAAKLGGAKVVYVANPDNPSGTWHTAEGIWSLIEALPPDCVLLLDEAYSDFAPADVLPSIDVADPRVVRIRTFSKAHGMAGARVGYAIACAETIGSINKIRMHFAVNLIAQAGALASLRDPEFLESVVRQVEAGRKDYEDLGSRLGLKTLPSATNFVCFDLASFERARAVMDELLKRGVFIRMPGAEPLNRCIRVTVGTKEERKRFAEELEAVVRG